MFADLPDQNPMDHRPEEAPNDAADGMYFVDFGPVFASELQKVLKYGGENSFGEIIFWQGEFFY